MGYILVFSGLVFAFSAVGQFGKLHTTLDPHGSVSAIVTSGPYRFSRNPIYLGFVCTLIGLPLALGNYWGAVLGPLLMLFIYQLVIKYEEIYLEEKFKDVYTSYKSRVRRWL
jgi:protein-S-isoprenylcysteine O-methyltransferase Ste14